MPNAISLVEPTTMILRFRDLVTEPGGTIEAHNAVSQKFGNVWWGWWNKSGEKIPDSVFRLLNDYARGESGLPILMLDSGREQVFSCICREIKWDINHNKISSPEIENTPSYYSGLTYYAWFRLELITEVDPTELQKYSCVQVDDFFVNERSRYNCFYEKRIYDASELRQQDRTIWFVRPSAPSDHVHEIKLLNGKQISPSNYEEDFAKSKSLNLLWVSDLHFSSENHAFPVSSTVSTHDLGQAIELAAGSKNIHDFAGVLVSGDITWKAEREEFDAALNFLGRVATSPSKLDNYRIAIVPGNHDLRFSDEPSDKAAAVNEVVAPESARAEFSRFYQNLFYLNPNQFLSSGRKFLLGGSIPVEVACLNSSLIDQKKGWYQGHGFVGDEQLRDVAAGMNWSLPAPSARPFRIVVLHHHLMPVSYRETPFGGPAYSVVFDAEAIVQWLVSHRVDLVLHGHMHKDFCARISRPIGDRPTMDKEWHTFHVLGMGSSGVKSEHRIGENTFGVLEFSGGGVKVSVFSVHKSEPSELVWTVNLERGSCK